MVQLTSNQLTIQTTEFNNGKTLFLLRHMDRPNCDTDDRHVIQLRSCPRCNTAIRRSLRYGNVIKQQLHDIEKVKSKVLEESGEVLEVQEKLETL